MEQEDIKVCRICSIMDVKLHDLRSHPLESYYESVIGTNPLYSNLPPYACYECAALVRKFYFFREKCLRSQAVLHSTADDFGKLKPKEVILIDRQGLHISSNLEIVKLPKIEVLLPQNPQINEDIKLEPGSDDEDDKFKVEDHNDATFNASDRSLSSDDTDEDDEPLSLHKKKKIQTRKSVKEKVFFKQEFEPEFAVSSEQPVEIEVPVLVERKKKRPMKKRVVKSKKEASVKKPNLSSDFKWNDFAQYIDVITLTLEEQKEEIEKRKESSNFKNSPFQCNQCYKGFIDNDAWKHHVSKHAPSAGSIECEVCKFRFKTKRAYQKHASNHEKKYACKSCPYISTNTTQAKQHQGWHKGITFKCKFCDEIFTIWTSYMSHVRIKHPSEFICGFCGYSFISKLGLAMHKTMMHKDVQEKEKAEEKVEEGPYCKECDVKFISTEAYKRHMVMSVKHTESTDSIKGCRTCGATFENSEELRLHHRKEHTRKRPKNYGKKRSNMTWPSKCEHCTEVIANAREYWTHFRRAHPDKSYPIQKNHVCDVCGKSFRGNAFLIYHKRTHTEERAYKCSQCDKAFFNRVNLNVHEKTHSDNRPYPCSVCFKAFKGKGALNRHFRSHTGQKPYECEVCGKGFSQSNSRKLHVRTVHLKQPAPYVSRNRLERRKQGPKEPPPQQFVY
ncbi:hypothetical protein PYW07_002611 [Mythimna separata]|uniref:Uncharacterized protein n=1 Tax=Mythimna separata TaxID=271217 RepID=A0AAD7YH01_MYTSE|nr:hypothetical protein PYW07_002611 [Mythimna separata]